jgi:hypothetical protein
LLKIVIAQTIDVSNAVRKGILRVIVKKKKMIVAIMKKMSYGAVNIVIKNLKMKKNANITKDIVKRKANKIKAICASNAARKGILRVIVGLANHLLQNLQKNAIYAEIMDIMKLIVINFKVIYLNLCELYVYPLETNIRKSYEIR